MEGMGRGRLFDRWGGGFILATVLGLAVAYIIGTSLLGDPTTPGEQVQNTGGTTGGTVPAAGQTAEPVEPVLTVKAYSLYVIQAGLFNRAEGAQKTLQDLQSRGFPASVTRAAPFKVMAGAYGSETAARSVAAEMRKQGLDAFITRLDVAPPIALPASGGDQMLHTVSVLTAYMQQVAQWWDSYAAGNPGAVDQLAGEARAVETAGSKLQGTAGDAAVGDLVTLTMRAGQSGQDMAALTQGTRLEAARVAMQDFLDLLRDYHEWAEARR